MVKPQRFIRKQCCQIAALLHVEIWTTLKVRYIIDSLMFARKRREIIKMGEWNVRDNRSLSDGCSIDILKLFIWLKKVDPKLCLNQMLLSKINDREYDPNTSEIEVSIFLLKMCVTLRVKIYDNGIFHSHYAHNGPPCLHLFSLYFRESL